MPRDPRWGNVDRLLGFDRHGHRRPEDYLGEETALLSRDRDHVDSAISPKEVTKVCLRLRHLVQEVVSCEVDVALITDPNSRIITSDVIKAAKEAGGENNKGCVVYGLLVNLSWFQQEAGIELWNSSQHNIRAEACGVIAKLIIEEEEDTAYLLHSVLLHRYSHLVKGASVAPTNVIEKAVDLHAVRVIGSSGYQKCINYLWRGWVVQDEDDPSCFVDYTDKDNTNFFVHMDPNRMRTPRNQNAAQLLFSVVYLGLYTIAINTVNPTGVFDVAEILLYFFTLGYVCDEIVKLYKVGYKIFGFWDVFNTILYSFLTASLAFRGVGLGFKEGSDGRQYYSEVSYNMLAFVAPMFWCRLLLYLDSFRFFGTMLVVLKVMLKESVIFFALLSFILVGFLQAFIGLDLAEDNRSTATSTIVTNMVKAVLANPELDGFQDFSAPWGTILYYLYTFIVMTVLLNVLIALYNSAYSDILGHADDEYLALFAHRTMQFVRAPDENVYIAPLNLVEIVISGTSEWWMNKKCYGFINDCFMAVLYSPLLVATAFFETRTASAIRRNRAIGEEDDDVMNEWEQLQGEFDFAADGWTKTCDAVKPNLADDPVMSELQLLRAEVQQLKTLLTSRVDNTDAANLMASQATMTADDPPEQDPDQGLEQGSQQGFSADDVRPNQYVVSEPPLVEIHAAIEELAGPSQAESPAVVLYSSTGEFEPTVVERDLTRAVEEHGEGKHAAGDARIIIQEEPVQGDADADAETEGQTGHGDARAEAEQHAEEQSGAGKPEEERGRQAQTEAEPSGGDANTEEAEDGKQSKAKQKKKKETSKGKDSPRADSSSSGRSI